MTASAVNEGTRDGIAELHALIREGQKPQAIADAFDRMTHAERVAATYTLDRGLQRALYKAVDNFLPVRLTEMVPPSKPALSPVRHEGFNTVPIPLASFSHFQKRFYRLPGSDPNDPKELGGANFQVIQWLTGPGYFVAVEDKDKPEVNVDYYRVPNIAPEGFFKIVPNSWNRSGLVYGSMVDKLRRVSQHVTIGSALKYGKPIGSWFTLVRDDGDAGPGAGK